MNVLPKWKGPAAEAAIRRFARDLLSFRYRQRKKGRPEGRPLVEPPFDQKAKLPVTRSSLSTPTSLITASSDVSAFELELSTST
jgi:hypothetical protein